MIFRQTIQCIKETFVTSICNRNNSMNYEINLKKKTQDGRNFTLLKNIGNKTSKHGLKPRHL